MPAAEGGRRGAASSGDIPVEGYKVSAQVRRCISSSASQASRVLHTSELGQWGCERTDTLLRPADGEKGRSVGDTPVRF